MSADNTPVKIDDEIATPPHGEISLASLSHKDLIAEIGKYKGHTVVLCFWSSWSIPDYHLLRDFVALYQKYRGRRVAFLSVSLGLGPDDRDHVMKMTLAHLKAAQAVMPNYLLEEDSDVWQSYWKIMATPAFVICDSKAEERTIFDLTRQVYTIKDVEDSLKAR